MKRPLASVGMSFLLTLAVLCVFWPSGSTLFALVLFVATALSFLTARGAGRKRLQIILISALCACLLLSLDTGLMESAAKRLCSGSAKCELVITEVRAYSNARWVTAQVKRADGRRYRRVDTTFELSPEQEFAVGDRMEASLLFCAPQEAELGETLVLKSEISGPVSKTGTDALRAYGAKLRSAMQAAVESVLTGEQAMVATAIITGDKTVLSPTLKLEFSRAGISHILVISGLHITFLLMGLFRFLRRCRVSRRGAALLCAVGSCACFVVYGTGASVVRAVVMCGAAILGEVLSRRTDSLTSMSVAALLLLAVSPRTAGSLSFLLSFGCCFALCAVHPAVLARLQAKSATRKNNAADSETPISAANSFFQSALAESLCATVCISLVTLPVLTAFGMDVSIVSPLANLPVLLLVQPLMIVAFGICLFVVILPIPALGVLCGFVCGLLGKLIILVARLCAAIPFAAVSTSLPWLRVGVLCGMSLAILLAVAPRGKLKLRLVALCTAIVLLAGWGAQTFLCRDSLRVLTYEAGAAAVSVNDRCAVVVYDLRASDFPYFESWLKSRFIRRVDYVIIATDVGSEAEDAAAKLAQTGQLLSYPLFCGSGTMDEVVLHLGTTGLRLSSDGTLQLSYAGAELCAMAETAGDGFSVTVRERGSQDARDADSLLRGFGAQGESDNAVIYIMRDGRVRAMRE